MPWHPLEKGRGSSGLKFRVEGCRILVEFTPRALLHHRTAHRSRPSHAQDCDTHPRTLNHPEPPKALN